MYIKCTVRVHTNQRATRTIYELTYQSRNLSVNQSTYYVHCIHLANVQAPIKTRTYQYEQHLNDDVLIEEQVWVAVEEVDERRRVASRRAHHALPVSALEVRLDHFVVFAVAQRHRLDPRTFQSVAE